MKIIEVAAFSDGDVGGNPAGVYITDQHPAEKEMQAIAAKIGHSETAFAEPDHDGWRVRYFSPESEVPFCGHATIALGATLAEQNGAGVFNLQLNETAISVEGFVHENTFSAALQSPGTQSTSATPAVIAEALDLFNYQPSDLDSNIKPAMADAGAGHLIIALNSRSLLRAMNYDLEAGRTFMNKLKLVTVMFVYAETARLFHVRNAFASGGVFEDPATGAAAAAFSGYLRDIQWAHQGRIDIVQGEDMGSRSLIQADISHEAGSSIRVTGSARFMQASNE